MLKSDEQAAALSKVLKRPENNRCADCGSKIPRWASVTFGVFVCLRCSGTSAFTLGLHRQIGRPIAIIRSVDLDGWTLKEVELYQHLSSFGLDCRQ